jgi:hypothetical protein
MSSLAVGKSAQTKDFPLSPFIKEIIMENIKDLVEAFAAIEKHVLKPTTIICTVCGNVFSVNDKDTSPCEHLKKLAEECKDWIE